MSARARRPREYMCSHCCAPPWAPHSVHCPVAAPAVGGSAVTQEQMYQVIAIMTAETAKSHPTSDVENVAQTAIYQFSRFSLAEKEHLHRVYRQKYPSLGGL